MKLVEVKNEHVENGKLTPDEKYTIEHYLKEAIKVEFKRMSLNEISSVLNDEMESPTNFVVERVSEMMGSCVEYDEDNEEETSFALEQEYYDFCIDYLRKLAVAKYGKKFSSTMQGYHISAPQRKRAAPKKRTPAIRVNVRKMF